MSKIIKLPLVKGIDTENNPSAVAVNPTKIENFNISRNGVLLKRDGMSVAETTISGNYYVMKYWLDPTDDTDSSVIYIGYNNSDGSLNYFTNNFETLNTMQTSFQLQYAEQISGTVNNISVDVTNWDGIMLNNDLISKTLYIKCTELQADVIADGYNEDPGNIGTGKPTLGTWASDPTNGTTYQIDIFSDTSTVKYFKNGGQVGNPEAMPTLDAPTVITQLDNLTLTFLSADTYEVGDSWSLTYFEGNEFELSSNGVDYSQSQIFGNSHSDDYDVVYKNDAEWFGLAFNTTLLMKISDLDASAVNDIWKVDLNAIPPTTNITNWGNTIRIGFGLDINPSTFQYIKRSWFWMGEEFLHSSSDFYYDAINYPRNPETWIYDGFTQVAGGELEEDTNYHYKATALFDGNQEALFEDKNLLATTGSGGSGLQTIQVKFKINYDDFSPRLTGMKFYRAKGTVATPNNSLYQHIKTFDLTNTASDVFSVDVSTAMAGRRLFMVKGWDTQKVFGEATGGKWSTATTHLEWDGTPSESATFTVPSVGTINADFVELSSAPASNKWGETSNIRLYPTSNSQMFGDPNMNDSGHYDFTGCPTGVGIFSNLSTFVDSATALSHSDTNNLTKPGHLRMAFSEDGFEGNLGINWGINPQTFFTSDTQSVVTTAPYFLFRYQHNHYNFETSSSAYQKMRPSIIIVRDGEDVYEKEGTWSPALYDNGVEIGSSAFVNSAVDCSDFQILSTDLFKVKFELIYNGDPDSFHYLDSWGCAGFIDNIGIRQMYNSPDLTNQYHHDSAMGIIHSGLPDNKLDGYTASIDGGTITQDGDYVIDEQIGDLIKFVDSMSWTGNMNENNSLVTSADAYEVVTGSEVRVKFMDEGVVGGAYHPTYASTSLNTRYSYSTPLGGRNFVANVKILNEAGVEEDYDDMVMYSEIAQPDVIPITNFIKLNDFQGGKIYGLDSVLSDLVVFSEKGIFRISVPESDPTSWSMVESEPNLGCVHNKGLVKWRNGVFFAGSNNIYYIDSNFTFIPISHSWKTDYLEAVDGSKNTCEFTVDDNNNRLICKINNTSKLYCFDLKLFEAGKEMFWYNIVKGTDDTDYDGFVKDNNNKVMVMSIDGDNTKIVDFVDPDKRITQAGVTHTDTYRGTHDLSEIVSGISNTHLKLYHEDIFLDELQNFEVVDNDIWLDGLLLGHINNTGDTTNDWIYILPADDDSPLGKGVSFRKPHDGTDVVFNFTYTMPQGFQVGRQCESSYKTGYIDLSNLAKGQSVFLRSINMEMVSYYGPLIVVVRIDSDDSSSIDSDDSNTFEYTIPATSLLDQNNLVRVRCGYRARGFQLELKTEENKSFTEIKNIEIEID